jgi:hypothetical protein
MKVRTLLKEMSQLVTAHADTMDLHGGIENGKERLKPKAIVHPGILGGALRRQRLLGCRQVACPHLNRRAARFYIWRQVILHSLGHNRT